MPTPFRGIRRIGSINGSSTTKGEEKAQNQLRQFQEAATGGISIECRGRRWPTEEKHRRLRSGRNFMNGIN